MRVGDRVRALKSYEIVNHRELYITEGKSYLLHRTAIMTHYENYLVIKNDLGKEHYFRETEIDKFFILDDDENVLEEIIKKLK